MARPQISVLMSVYNGERYLRSAIESVLSQSFADFEFIVIDDGSTDSSHQILEEMARKDARLKLFRQENHGLVASLNRALMTAEAPYVARMDADDISHHDRFAMQHQRLESQPDIAVLGGSVRLIAETGQPLSIVRYPKSPGAAFYRQPGFNPIPHPAVMARTEILRGLGGYSPLYPQAEDYALWIKAAGMFRLANLPDIVLDYRIHPAKMSAIHARSQVISGFVARMRALGEIKDNNEVLATEELLDQIISAHPCRQRHELVFKSWLAHFLANSGRDDEADRIGSSAFHSHPPALLPEEIAFVRTCGLRLTYRNLKKMRFRTALLFALKLLRFMLTQPPALA